MNILIDESVSIGIVEELRLMNYSVQSVALDFEKGTLDVDVWEIAKQTKALLITRDNHFTNRVRYNPKDVFGIIFLRHGNLKSETEINLITRFLHNHPSKLYKCKLVTLLLHEIKIRD